MWYKDQRIIVPKLIKRSAFGRFEPDEQIAKKQGIRYKKWSEVIPNWYANAGINRPFFKYMINGAHRAYSEIVGAYESRNYQEVIELEYNYTTSVREKIKLIFEDPKSTILFDSNGSCVISTIAKTLRGTNESLQTFTFSDQGRLVYAALGFEANSMSEYRSNFDQQRCLLDAPPPQIKIWENPRLPKEVKIVDIFYSDNRYKSDAIIIDEYKKILKNNPGLQMVLLLHVSRTGRRMPIDDLIELTRKIRDNIHVFVDGCQAVGRVSWQEVKRVYSKSDGYIFVGHKALGSMICGVAVLKKGIEQKFANTIKNSLLHTHKLFQFETEKMNKMILDVCEKNSKEYYFVSAPEAVSLSEAVEDNYYNFWKYHKIIADKKENITRFLKEYDCIKMNMNNCPTVDDIISFNTEPLEMASYLKQYLQKSDPPITIAPLTNNMAIRIAIDPKSKYLSNSLEYLKIKLDEAMKEFGL
jgi:hypothetical protein